MRKIDISEIRNIREYEKIRTDYRKKIIDIKKHRRIILGDRLSLLFENRETLIFQIQEILRMERIIQEERIWEEINIFNSLVPAENELSATLFIEVVEPNMTKVVLNSLRGIEANCISLKLGNKFTIYPSFDPKQIDWEGLSAVQYLKFKFNPAEKELFTHGDVAVFLSINHQNYQFYKALSEETKKSLFTDFVS